jgi:UbiD family decarboxylase
VVGALAASPQIYALGMGRRSSEIGDAWMRRHRPSDPPVDGRSAPCQEVVITGDGAAPARRRLGALPVPVSTPGFDAAPYLTATLCITRDPDNGVQNMGTYRAALKATDRLGVRMVARIGGAGGYLHWLKYRAEKADADAPSWSAARPWWCSPGRRSSPIDLDEMAVAGGLAGAPIRMVKAVRPSISMVPADAEIVIEGLDRSEKLEPEGPFGESHGYVALEDFNMSMQVTAITHKRKPVFASIMSQVTPSESSVIKRVAYEPRCSSRICATRWPSRACAGGAARAADQSAPGHLRAVRAGAAHRGVARLCTALRRCMPIAARSSSP